MMTKKELLGLYRATCIELEELRRQIDRIGTDGRPAGCRSLSTDRIGRSTNDPAAASAHLADGLEAIAHNKEETLRELGEQVEALLRGITDYRTYLVVQHYYVLAQTDEQIGQTMCLTKSRVNQIRLEYLRAADA